MDDVLPPAKRARKSSPSLPVATRNELLPDCPHLSTVNRQILDLDLKLHCSVTLSVHNIYICLVCSRYLQGRSESTPAYVHSLQERHHLFLCAKTLKTYCLPDNYQVEHASLREIALAFRSTFTADDVRQLDKQPFHVRLPNGSRLRGAVPLAYLHAADYISVTTQLLLRSRQLRDCLLLSAQRDEETPASDLRNALTHICSRIWSKNALRDFVAPHNLLDIVESRSQGLFSSLKQNDPVLLLAWFLRTLTVDTDDEVAKTVKQCFRGEMTVVETGLDVFDAEKVKVRGTLSDGNSDEVHTNSAERNSKSSFRKEKRSQFWFLPLDLPPEPLFKDADDRALVSQISLEKLMRKYDGVTKQHVVKTAHQRSFVLVKVPECLTLVVKRFVRSKFGLSKNPCIVHLPQTLHMSEWCAGAGEYELKAAILHEGKPKDGRYRVAIRHDASDSWYELNGNQTKLTHFQLVSLADTYILLYQRIIHDEDRDAT
ncbi:snrnp assembly factor and ubiquitin specific protease 39 [Gracilaria domingensis]|nr:snrnp assembly factor and ubiquitin specific protease 39 [Gracilaria domingensis]